MTAVILLGSTVAVCLIILVAACSNQLVIYFPSVLFLKFRGIHLIGTKIFNLSA